jgi:16S rRNA (cytidine1402-2'-O)-methyltransferase
MENGILYIVATPIGNLSDITFRAIETLKVVDAILCEDTRETKKLLSHFNIVKPMMSLHQHSTPEKVDALLQKYANVAYVSDAGTPGISDPGNKIVSRAVLLGKRVEPIPGACAVIAGLSVSGLPTDKFLFLGFMPHKGKTKIFETIKNSDYTVCFYESPHRVLKTLLEMKNFVTGRNIVVGRELTKKFESIYRGNIDEVIEQVKDKQKGEFVVIVGC